MTEHKIIVCYILIQNFVALSPVKWRSFAQRKLVTHLNKINIPTQ